MIRRLVAGSLLAVASVAGVARSGFAQIVPSGSNVPSYARPTYATREVIVRGRVEAVDDAETLRLRDDSGLEEIVEITGATINRAGRDVQEGAWLAVRGVRNGSGFRATQIDPIQVSLAAPKPAAPVPRPAVDPGPPLPYVAPTVSPTRAPQVEHLAVPTAIVKRPVPRKPARPVVGAAHTPRAYATTNPQRRIAARPVVVTRSVRRVWHLQTPSPTQPETLRWYGWGKL
jgi:hypothetical protein